MLKPNFCCLLFIAILAFVNSGSSYGQTANRFNIAGYENDTVFTNYYHRFQSAVEQNDSSYIASLIEYPLDVYLGGMKPVKHTYKGAKAFLKHYSRIFNKRLKDLILSTPADSLFVNSQGVMLGSGQIWFYYIEDTKGKEETVIWSVMNYRGLYEH